MLVIEDKTGYMVETLCNILLVRRADHDSFPKHMGMLERRHKVMNGSGFNLTNEDLQDTCVTDL